MEMTESRLIVDEIERSFSNQRLSPRNEDAETMEQKLKTILQRNLYTREEGLFELPAPPHCLYQWGDLKTMLNATDEELGSALRRVSALEVNGYWRIPEPILLQQVLYCLVMKLSEAERANLQFDGNKAVNSTVKQGYPLNVTRHCLEVYGTRTDGSVWKLDAKRVSVALALFIVRRYAYGWELQDFMAYMSRIGFPVSLDMLKGEILIEKHGNQTRVSRLPSNRVTPVYKTKVEVFSHDVSNQSVDDDDMCIGQVLYYIVWKAESNDWSFNSLDGNKVVESLRDTWGCSPVVARLCLELYASTTDGRVWEMDTKRVCVELARWVIKSNKKKMKFEEFMVQWSCVGLPVSFDMLEGEVLVEEHDYQSWVYLPSDLNTPASGL